MLIMPQSYMSMDVSILCGNPPEFAKFLRGAAVEKTAPLAMMLAAGCPCDA